MMEGGAEKFVATLLSRLDRSKFAPALALVKKEGAFLGRLPDDIPVIDLHAGRVRKSIFGIIRLTWTVRPDVVFSTLGHLNLMLMMIRFLMPPGIRFIGRETSIVSLRSEKRLFPQALRYLYTIFYNCFDRIVCQSDYMKNDLVACCRIAESRVLVINNPVDFDRIDAELENRPPALDTRRFNLVAVGRLEKVKGFDMLLEAFSKLREPGAFLTILGSGAEQDSLRRLCGELGLEGSVEFAGFVENPYAYMRDADLLVVTSHYEGFPNAVLEAHACGTPVVGFECPGGIREIILDGRNGFLVAHRDTDALAREIARARQTVFDRTAIRASARSRYSAGDIIPAYERLLETV